MNIFREYDCYFNSPEKLFILNLDCTKQISENNRRINKKLFGMGKKPNPLFVRVTCMYNFAILKPHLRQWGLKLCANSPFQLICDRSR